MLNEKFYKQIIKEQPIGYACYNALYDKSGNIMDFVMVDINHVLKNYLEKRNLYEPLGRSINEILCDENNERTQVFALMTEVLSTERRMEIELISAEFHIGYRVTAFTPQADMVVTYVMHLSNDLPYLTELDNSFNHSLDLYCVANTDFCFVKMNSAWFEVLGYRAEEMENTRFLDYVHPDDIESTIHNINSLANQEAISNFINRYRTKNGDYRYIEWRSRQTGNLIYAAARDITERKATEEKLKSSEENFRTFFETIDDMIFIANQSGEIFFTNKAVTEKLGYTPEEIKGMHVLDVNPAEKRDEAIKIFEDMFAGKRRSCPLPLVRKEGSHIPCETRVWKGRWNGEECIFGISKDLSKEQESLNIF